MPGKSGLAVALFAFTVLLVLPAGAVAKPGYEVRSGSARLDLFLDSRDGNRASISAGNGQRVEMLVERGLFSAVDYFVKGQVSSKRIEADFGELGQVDIVVQLDKDTSASPPRRNRRCKGRDPLYVWGDYRGTIKFSGEGDLPAFSSRRGNIRFTRRFRQICKRRTPEKEQASRVLEIGVLQARAKGEGRTTLLEATSLASSRDPVDSIGFLVGVVFERREQVGIARGAAEIFGSGVVMSKRGKKPETVLVKPEEAPFAGQARYLRRPGSPAEWTGDLSARLPGASRLPFTGPGFNTTFCRSFSFDKVLSCIRGDSPAQPSALARRTRAWRYLLG